MRFGIVHILRFYQNAFTMESDIDYTNVEKVNNVVRAAIVMILNFTIGIILLLDLDRKKSLTWILCGLTLINPWMSIIFFLIWKTADRKI
jgi:presenilin-like A22 family membrane protease